MKHRLQKTIGQKTRPPLQKYLILWLALCLIGLPSCKNSLSELNLDQSFSITTNPGDGATLTAVSQLEIYFPTIMNGMTVLTNYQLSGTGKNTLSIQSVTDQGNNRVLLQFTGYARTGSLFITLSNITDIKGRPIKNPVLSYNLVIPGPTITATPAAGSVVKTLAQVDLSYSSPVNAAALQNTNYIFTNASGGNLSVTSVTSLGGNNYRLTISGVPGNGALQITFINIEDLAGNTPSTTSIAYTADTTDPTVTTLNPADTATFNSVTEITVNFSEAVSNADTTASYVLSGTGVGTLSKTSVTNLGANSYRLNLGGTASAGTLTLNLSGITDTAGNTLSFAGANYTVDPVAPVIQTSVPANGTAVSTPGSVVITFSKAVNGANVIGNYAISGTGTGTLAVTGITPLGGNVYTVNLSGSPVTGSIVLTLSGITAVSNGLALSGTTISYSVDVSAPTITGTTPAGATLVNALTQFDITFSEVMSNAGNIASYSVTNNGTGTLTVTNAVNLAGNTFRLTLTGNVGSGAFSINSTATDLAGNTVISGSTSLNADGVAPTISSSTPTNGASLNSMTQVELTYSETVSGGGTAGNYILSGAGAAGLSVSGVTPLGGNSYRVNIAGTPVNGAIVLTANSITDTALNALSPNTLSFTGDFSGPTITGSPVHNGTVNQTFSQWDLTYSEAVINSLVSGNYVISGTGVNTLLLNTVTNQGGNTVRLNFTGAPTAGTITLNISNIEDNFGNALVTTSLSLTVDTTAPTYVATPTDATILNALTQVDFAFSEPMLGCTTPANYTVAGAGKGTLAITGATLQGGNTYRLTLSGSPGNGAVTITLGSGITDVGGTPPASTVVNYTADTTAPTKTANIANYTPVGISLSAVIFTYSETVNNALVNGNYTVSGTGAGTLSVNSVTNPSGNDYQVNFNGSPVQGVITITISGVSDPAGNALTGTSITLVGGFTKYRKLTMNNSGIATSHNNFTVPVVLNGSRINYGIMQADGKDIGFYDSDLNGFALLPHQIEKWVNGGDSLVWVKVPTVTSNSSADYFYMYYGYATGTDTQSATAVWDTNYRAVWHFSESVNNGGTISDSTSLAHNGTSNGILPGDLMAGKLGNGYSLDGSTKFISVPDSANLRFSNSFTLEMWINWTSATSIVVPLFEKGLADTDNYNFFLKSATVTQARMSTEFIDTTANFRSFQEGSASITAPGWTHVAIVYTPTGIKVYKNGDLIETMASTYTLQNAITHPLLLGKGNNGGFDSFFQGTIDEARISNAARSDNFIKAQYRAMNDTFLAFGPEN